MATTTQTKFGQCPTHGQVSATREVPKLDWPFAVSGVKRIMARNEPFRCPTCNSPVEV